MDLNEFILESLAEDIGPADHTSLACIPENSTGKAKLIAKEDGIIAGVELAEKIFKTVDYTLKVSIYIHDGIIVKKNDVVLIVEGSSRSILSAERLVLNCMQRMSGISTLTSKYVDKLKGYHAKLLDTRKTTPLFRQFEKWAVRIGGGHNHRFGLYDMMMIKDNHIDYSRGIKNAITNAVNYLERHQLNLEIEIETRNLEEVKEVLKTGKVNRIMLDNFTAGELSEAIKLINGKLVTEASGGITLDTIRSYAQTGVDYISCGAIIHSAPNFDLSLKAIQA